MASLKDLIRKYRPAVREANRGTGRAIQSMVALPAEKFGNAAIDAVHLGRAAYGAIGPKTFQQSFNDVPQPKRITAGTDALQRQVQAGDITQGQAKFGSAAVGVGASFATPGIGKVGALDRLASPLAKFAGYSAVRGAEGAAQSGLSTLATTGDTAQAKKSALTGAALGVGLNAILSPKLAGQAGKELGYHTADITYRSQNIRKAANLFDALPPTRVVPGKVGRGANGKYVGPHVESVPTRELAVPADYAEKILLSGAKVNPELSLIYPYGSQRAKDTVLHFDSNGDIRRVTTENKALRDRFQKSLGNSQPGYVGSEEGFNKFKAKNSSQKTNQAIRNEPDPQDYANWQSAKEERSRIVDVIGEKAIRDIKAVTRTSAWRNGRIDSSNLPVHDFDVMAEDLRTHLNKPDMTASEVLDMVMGLPNRRDIKRMRPGYKAPQAPSETTYYHGTNSGNDFESFDPKRAGLGVGGNEIDQGNQIYLTQNKDAADFFASKAEVSKRLQEDRIRKARGEYVSPEMPDPNSKGNVLKFNISKEAKIKRLKEMPRGSASKDLVEQLKKEGYDAVSFPDRGFDTIEGVPALEKIYKGGSTPPETTIVLNPSKLKKVNEPLTGNNGELNVNRLNLTPEVRQRLSETVDSNMPIVRSAKGAPVSRKEVAKAAADMASASNGRISRDEIVQYQARMLQTRQGLAQAAADSGGKMTPELKAAMMEDLSQSKFLASSLSNRAAVADPYSQNPLTRFIKEISDHGTDLEEVMAKADGVDFNDPKQATDFFREFVKPNVGNWIDLLRYNSMLSSPNTQINNFFGNAIQVGLIKPTEKTIAGGIDFLHSSFTGKEREIFVGEGGRYLGSALKSIGDGARAFGDAMSGKALQTNLDSSMLPLATSGAKGAAYKTLSFPMRVMEGMDQFFQTLARAGEESALAHRIAKGGKIGGSDIKQIAQSNAERTVFRKELGDPKEGYVLNAIDRLPTVIQNLKGDENPIIRTIAKWSLPFIKTPTNILKQGLEYSPLGVTTLAGNANKTEQLAKAALGSAVFGGAATLLGAGRLTWGVPTSKKEKQAFYAAGMQPYAVKVGDKWVSYVKLGPIAYPIAMVAAIDDAQKNGKLDESTSEQIINGIAKYGQFFADQSYMKSMGDLLNVGQKGGTAKVFSNYPQQLVPFRAALGWVARLTDDLQRDPYSVDGSFIDKQVAQMMAQIPGLSKMLPPRTDPEGVPLKAQNPVLNAFSPLRVTTENPRGKAQYEGIAQKRRDLADANVPKARGRVTVPSASIQEKVARRAIGTERNLSIRKAKEAKDYASWESLQKDRYNALKKESASYDPQLDADKVASAKSELDTILTQVRKYRSYGGAFSKPKKGAKPRVRKVSVKAGTSRAIAAPKVRAPKNVSQPKVRKYRAKKARVRVKQPKR